MTATDDQPSLRDRLQADLTDSMKRRDAVTTSTLRMAISAVRNAEVAGATKVTLDDDAVLDVLAAETKKRVEAAEIYTQAGHAERAAAEEAEADVLRAYLPAALDDEALEAVVAEEVAAAAADGATGAKAMGAVIKAVRTRVGNQADGARVAAAVKAALA